MRSRVFIVCLLLAGCAPVLVAPPAADLYHDALFAAPSARVDAKQVFALSDAMRGYVERAHQRQGCLRVERRDEAVSAPGSCRRDGDERPAPGADRRREPGSAQARVRQRAHAHRRRSVRGARRQLPVARHHDGRVCQGARHRGAVSPRVDRRHVEPRRQHLLPERPRQPVARQALCRSAHALRRGRAHDHRLPARPGAAGTAHRAGGGGHDRGDVYE